MPWKKITSNKNIKREILKARTISEELNEAGVIDRRFEIMLYNLSLDEIISLKLEQAVKSANYKLFGIPLLEATEESVKFAVIRYAFSVCNSTTELASFLGTTIESIDKMRKKYSWLAYSVSPKYKYNKELENQ